MQAVEMEKAFNPKSFEDRIYTLWKESGAFSPRLDAGESGVKAKPYVIVIPPPNVTGILHLGHGLNISLQDIVIRFHRMRGEPALWVPGTDHAGIATQHVVEKRLKAQGRSRHDLGREKFIEAAWEVKKEHHAVISRQIARIGASVDWSRERFTLDEGLSRAVREVFVSLYERNLIYKGHYLVNWCTSCGTALSDDEVDHEETGGKMYHLRYPLVDGGGFVELATTRPETLLGDTAVAVHPEDERYRHLAGKEVFLPLTGRKIPVIADTYVDKEFGTGVVKITPAHDPNDWEVARRHDLPVISILNPDGRLNDKTPEKYRGLTVKDARDAVLSDLKEGGFYIREEDITHAVGHCYRCNTVIEPFLSEQWFVRMKPLAKKALESWERGELIFYPRKWENTYRHWLSNIRDWCISRQLWWGHRIPAWRCADCGRDMVSRNDIDSCPHCGSIHVVQDPDVLDTWFSSWLWPFSTLGWPDAVLPDTPGGAVDPGLSSDQPHCENSKKLPRAASPGGFSGDTDLSRFYPTTALVTAYDIIFFWVSRMIMAGLEFTGKAPFRDIYIHGLLRDKQGRKMSKSLGNGLDPLELVDEFGADALRFTLAFMCAQGQDILVDKESFKLGSKFANKVWNAGRYILMNLEGRSRVREPGLLPADEWIYSRLNGAAKAMIEAFLSYRYNDAAQRAYEYFWNDFCDWYVEATKLSMREGGGAEKDRAATVLLDVFAESLRLLHPFLPFVTEEIYGKLPAAEGAENAVSGQSPLLINAPYPEYREERNKPRIEEDFSFLQELVRMVRTLRSECTIPPEKKISARVRLAEGSGGGGRAGFLRDNAGLVRLLAGLGDLEIEEEGGAGRPRGAIGLAGNGFEVFVYVAEAVDMDFLKRKFLREIERDGKFIAGVQAKLSNGQFLKNAPAELVAAEKVKLEGALRRTANLESYIRDMG